MSQGDIRYPPIGDYGMIGDLRSAALVSKQGSIDWMWLPRFDSPWIFGRLLDWDKGGYLQLGLPGGALAYRQYRRDSTVIQTVGSKGPARRRVVDWRPIAVTNNRVSPRESWRLTRMMQPVAGTSQWRLTFKPRFDYGREVPSVTPVRPGLLSAASPQGNAFLQIPEDAAIALADGEASVTGRVLPGHRAAVLLNYRERGGRPPAPITMDQPPAYLHQTDDYWLGWLRSSSSRGRFDEPLHRSALALKLMQYLPTGAFVAAPTTSLPESLGGSLNWDYRYTWIRDTSDLVNALPSWGSRMRLMPSCAGSVWHTIVTRSTSRSCTRSTARTACPSMSWTTWKGTADRSRSGSATPRSSSCSSTSTGSCCKPLIPPGNPAGSCPSRDGRSSSGSSITSSITGSWKIPASGNRAAGLAATSIPR